MKFSNPDKVLFPEAGITKKALVAYYRVIAPYILPHIEGRPLSFVRFPDGAGGEQFYQKEANDSISEDFEPIEVEIDGTPRTYLSAESEAAVARFGTLVAEPHIWISRRPDVRQADIIVWDLDPAGAITFEHTKTGARVLKKLLESLGAVPHIKLTGSRGLHVSLTLDESLPVGEAFEISKALSDHLSSMFGDVFTTEFAKQRRGNRIYLDYLRNRYAQTFAAPYAVRARGNAPIAAPIRWDDLDGIAAADEITIANVPRWLKGNDSWLQDWGAATSDTSVLREKVSQLSTFKNSPGSNA